MNGRAATSGSVLNVSLCLCVALGLCGLPAMSAPEEPDAPDGVAADLPRETPSEKEARMAWWRDAGSACSSTGALRSGRHGTSG